jgi:hypothetical protein
MPHARQQKESLLNKTAVIPRVWTGHNIERAWPSSQMRATHVFYDD